MSFFKSKVYIFSFFLFFLITSFAEANLLDEKKKELSNMAAVDEIFSTLVAFVEIEKDYINNLDSGKNEGSLWPEKVFSAGNKIIYILASSRNPLKECFHKRYENLASYVRGEITSIHELSRKEARTTRCIEGAQKELIENFGSSVVGDAQLHDEYYDLSRFVIGLAKTAVSGSGAGFGGE